MFGGQVAGLARVRSQVVKRERLLSHLLSVAAGDGVHRRILDRQGLVGAEARRLAALAGRAAVRQVRVGEVQFPFTRADGVEFFAGEVEQRLMRGGVVVPAEEGQGGAAVDLERRGFASDDFGQRGQEIDGHERRRIDATRRHLAGPADDERRAHAAFEAGQLALAESAVGAGVLAVARPRAVVGEEDHQRIPVQPGRLQFGEQRTNRLVQLFDHVSVKAALRAALELIRSEDRHMRHHVGQVEEERAVLVSFDEIDASGREAGRERRLVRVEFGDLLAVEQRERRHLRRQRRMVFRVIVGVGQAEEFVEALARRRKLRDRPEVPLAEAGRRDRKSTRLNSSHSGESRMPSSA